MDFCKMFRVGILILIIASSCAEEQQAEHVEIEFNSNPILGNENAKVQMIIFTDYECSYCKQLIGYLEGIKKSHLDAGKLQVQIWDYPLENHEYAFSSAICAYCAGQQGLYWEMHQLLYESQGALGDGVSGEFARELSLNLSEYDSCFSAATTKEKIESDIDKANQLGISGTPAFIINGKLYRGTPPEDVFVRLIDDAIASDG